MKKIFRYLHLWLGLASGLVVFVVAVTGCIYCFEKEIRSVVYKDVLSVEKGTTVQSLDQLLSLVKKEYKKPGVKNIFIPEDSTSAIQFNLKNKLSVYVNPYTGEITGTVNQRLLLGEIGEVITGVSAFIFLFMLISGIILWWPRGKKFSKQNFTLKPNASAKRRNFDLHSILGFYASWIIVFTVFTGLIFSFKWVENSMFAMVGSKKKKNNIILLMPIQLIFHSRKPSPFADRNFRIIKRSLLCYRRIH